MEEAAEALKRKRRTFFRRATLARRCSQVFSLLVFAVLFLRVGSPFRGELIVGGEGGPFPVESFLWSDPLVGLSAILAGNVRSLAALGLALLVGLSLLLPRGYCSHICPMGTLIDVVGFLELPRRKDVAQLGGNTRFWGLAVFLSCGLTGVSLTGYLSPLPLLTRGMAFSAGTAHFALIRGWDEVWPETMLAVAALVPLVVVLGLNAFGRRFWCRKLCPSGALYSLGSPMGLLDRRVGRDCTGCGQCAKACRFDAVAEDYSDRPGACSRCGECGTVCPVGAIHYAWRWTPLGDAKPPEIGDLLNRRAALATIGGATAIAALARVGATGQALPCLRPPGSRAEGEFLDLCVRCGACMRVCPGPVLHPRGFEDGLEGFLAPKAVPTHAGCIPECNLCTQACPTGAIRPLTREEKLRFVMGIAAIDRRTCLPWAGTEECRLCYEECEAAGYRAIEMRTIELQIGDVPEGMFTPDEIEAMSHIEAPFVIEGKCTGCGLCEFRCHHANSRQQGKLGESAIVVSPSSRAAG